MEFNSGFKGLMTSEN